MEVIVRKKGERQKIKAEQELKNEIKKLEHESATKFNPLISKESAPKVETIVFKKEEQQTDVSFQKPRIIKSAPKVTKESQSKYIPTKKKIIYQPSERNIYHIKKLDCNNIPDLSGITIYGISGFKGSGKDTLGVMIQQAILADTQEKVCPYLTSFANGIRHSVLHAFNGGIPIEYEEKEKPLEFWSNVFGKQICFRDLFINFGEIMRKTYGPQIWHATLLKTILNQKERGRTVFVVSDVRFVHEIKFLKELSVCGADVKRILIKRKAVYPDWKKAGLKATDPEDRKKIFEKYNPPASEFEWCAWHGYYYAKFKNNGTKKELQQQVEEIFAPNAIARRAARKEASIQYLKDKYGDKYNPDLHS